MSSRAEHVRAKAIIKTISGQSQSLAAVFGSVALSYSERSKAKQSALKLLDPIFRAFQLLRIADADEFLGSNLSLGKYLNEVVADLKRNSGGIIPSSKLTTQAMRKQLERCQKACERTHAYAKGLTEDSKSEPDDPGWGKPQQFEEQYIQKSLLLKSRMLKEFSVVFAGLARLAKISSFDYTAIRRWSKISNDLLRARKRIRRKL